MLRQPQVCGTRQRKQDDDREVETAAELCLGASVRDGELLSLAPIRAAGGMP